MKHLGYHEDLELCIECGKGYYPPENHPQSPNGLGVCKKGYYVPICSPCKVKRKLFQLVKSRRRRQIKLTLMKKPSKRDIILNKLRERPHTSEELLYLEPTIRSHISYLRGLGYDIRMHHVYTLVREPKDRLIVVKK